jgi:hypothetical protein
MQAVADDERASRWTLLLPGQKQLQEEGPLQGLLRNDQFTNGDSNSQPKREADCCPIGKAYGISFRGTHCCPVCKAYGFSLSYANCLTVCETHCFSFC